MAKCKASMGLAVKGLNQPKWLLVRTIVIVIKRYLTTLVEQINNICKSWNNDFTLVGYAGDTSSLPYPLEAFGASDSTPRFVHPSPQILATALPLSVVPNAPSGRSVSANHRISTPTDIFRVIESVATY